MKQRGILLPIFSLPSPDGIGCFSQDATTFLRRLKEAGQQAWQILPFNPSGKGNSPYQPLSCFAGDPLFIDLAALQQEGLLHATERERFQQVVNRTGASRHDRYIRYDVLRPAKRKLLHLAFSRDKAPSAVSKDGLPTDFAPIRDYAFFAALSHYFHTTNWSQWPDDIRLRTASAMKHYEHLLQHEIAFQLWMQRMFFQQWDALRAEARQNGISLIGDLPFYAGYESADCWAHPECFQLNAKREMEWVSGAPPDAFTPDGQKWNTPLYDWDTMKHDGWHWWAMRMRHHAFLFDIIRLDHTRGFSAYYTIPAQDHTAIHGHWEPGPGLSFFREMRRQCGSCRWIAEDLGYLTPDVRQLMHDAGLPGMKVLQFAFDSDRTNPYLPDQFGSHCVVYTGTHDNDTTLGWYQHLPVQKQQFVTRYAAEYLHLPAQNHPAPAEQAVNRMISMALRSPAELCIIPMQDWLRLGSDARINTPGTIGGNWDWRMLPGTFTRTLAEQIRQKLEKET